MNNLTDLERTTIQYSQFSSEEWRLITFSLRLLINTLKTETNKEKIKTILTKCPSASL